MDVRPVTRSLPIPALPISVRRPILAVVLATAASACTASNDDDTGLTSVADDDGGASTGNADESGTSAGDGGTGNVDQSGYAVASLAFGTDETSLFVTLVDALDGRVVDFADSREFVGSGDMWIHDGSVFVAEASALTITKFSVENGAMVETGKVSFGNYGLTDLGFWVNTFVSPTKAYLINGTTEHIVWNPSTMEITGTVPLPTLTEHEGFTPFASYSDRSVVLRDGLLYQPVYFTDESFFSYTQDSEVLVLDVETDTFQPSIVTPCPGLDFATSDSNGDIVFSNWVYAAGGAAFLDQPQTCVSRIAVGASEATVDFDFADIAQGRQGAGFNYTGEGKALFATLHDERVTEPEPDPSAATFGSNWRFWSYDAATQSAAMIEAIDWNAGAAYWAKVDDRAHILVPSGDYTSTIFYDVTDPTTPVDVLQTDGWSLRLFAVQ